MSERPERMLSYSSILNLMGCQQKYWHRKIAKTQVDRDYTQSDALAVGKAFHQVLEDSLHDMEGLDIEESVQTAMNTHKVDSLWFTRLCAMITAYDKMHRDSGLKTLFCEMEIQEEFFLGYIDAVMVDPSGMWWIVDLKTAARIDGNLKQTLPYDLQMNLYSQKFKTVAKNLNLSVDKFGGCRYRATTKPYPAKMKKNETPQEYIARLAGNVTATDLVIHASELAQYWLATQELFDSSVKTAKALKEGKQKPIKNMGYCMSYFKPCEYWSKCHGDKIFSEPTRVEYHDHETHFQAKQLQELL